MFRSSNFDKLLEKATSNLRLEPDWPAILQICDLIRQNDVTPKYAVLSIKKKLYAQNPHQAMFGMLVLESIVKNCGSVVHDEITTKANCEMYRELVTSSAHDNVRAKMIELIQNWAFAFRSNPKYRAIQDTMNILKTEGHTFPAMKESDAMFSADTAPEWADGEVCHRCRVQFSMIQRKHHCRACGQVFCAQCSSKTCTLPKFGIEKEVRVCDACFEQVGRPVSSSRSPSLQNENELPAEYVTSSLAQQNQTPARRTAQELQEEEELQLALALSKSEAEVKNAPKTIRTQNFSPIKEVLRHSPSPVEDAADPELARYLNRGYWEQRQESQDAPPSPSAPAPAPSPMPVTMKVAQDPELDEFTAALKSQIEIFVNRMKSNSSRGRSIANDSSVQTLFLNLTAMHSRLLRYIQQQDDAHVHFEGLQDKLTQVKDSRAALDVLREEYREKLRKQAEEAERQRQLQMAHKLDIMRKKKQEYLQYQRQLALQKIQEQEREMQMRQEQQKQQYLMGPQYYMQGSPVHGQQFPPQMQYGYPTFPMMHMASQGPMGPQLGMPGQNMGPPGNVGQHIVMGGVAGPMGPPNQNQMGPQSNQNQMQQPNPNQVIGPPQLAPGNSQMGAPNQQLPGPPGPQLNPPNQSPSMMAPPQNPAGPIQQNQSQVPHTQAQMGAQGVRNPVTTTMMTQAGSSMNVNQGQIPMSHPQVPSSVQHISPPMIYNSQTPQSSAPPGSPQNASDAAQTAELISFD